MLTGLLWERAALSESLLSGIASTRLWRPPAAQQMTRHLSGPPARARDSEMSTSSLRGSPHCLPKNAAHDNQGQCKSRQ